MAVVDQLILRAEFENRASGPMRSAIQDARKLGDEAESTGRRSRSAFSSMANSALDMGTALGKAAGRMAVDIGTTAVTKIADFRQEMAEVSKTTGIAGNDLQKLGENLRDLALDELGGNVAADQLTDIAAAAGQLGVQEQSILAFTKDVAELSKAMDLTADKTSEDMAKIANQFSESLEKPRMYFNEFGQEIGITSKGAYEQLSNIGSAINELSNNTTASAATLINMTKRMAGMGASVGLTVDQVSSLAATMTDAGLGIEKGSTAMNKMLGELYKNTDSFASALKLNSQELASALSQDPMAAIEMVMKGMDTMKQQEGPKALLLAVEELLGKGDGITQLALNLSSKYADLGKNADMAAEAFREGTSAHEEFLAQTDNTRARWDAIGEKANELYRRLGEELEPLTELITGWVSKGADILLAGFDTWNVVKDDMLADFRSGLETVFGKETLNNLLAGNFGEALDSLGTRVADFIAGSPFGPIVAGLGTVAEGGKRQFDILVGYSSDAIAQIAQGDYEGAFGSIVSGIRLSVHNSVGVLNELTSGISDFIGTIPEKFDAFAAQFDDTPIGPALEQIGTLIGNIIGTVQTLLETGSELRDWGLGLFKEVFTAENIEATLGFAVVVLGSIAEAVNLAYEGFESLGTLIGEVFSGEITFEDFVGGVKVMAADLFQWLQDTSKEAWETIWGWVEEQARNAFDNILDGMLGKVDAMVSKVTGLVNKIPFVGGGGAGEAVNAATTAAADAMDRYTEAATEAGVVNEKAVGLFQKVTDKIYGVEDALEVHSLTPALERYTAASESSQEATGRFSDALDANRGIVLATDSSVQSMSGAVGGLESLNPTESWSAALQQTATQISELIVRMDELLAASTSSTQTIGEQLAETYRLQQEYEEYRARKVEKDLSSFGSSTGSMEEYLINAGREDLLQFIGSYHQGGSVPQRYHRGGYAPDEVPAILQTGEYVLSRSDVRAIQSNRAEQIVRKVKAAKYHDGGAVGGTGGTSSTSNTTHVTLSLDGKTIFNEVVSDRRNLSEFVKQINVENNRQERSTRVG